MLVHPDSTVLGLTAAGAASVLQIVAPRLDGENIQDLIDAVGRLAADQGRREFDLDFGAVTFVTGSGLGHLVGLHRRLRATGGRLTISNVGRSVYLVFDVTRLTTVLDVRPKKPA